MKKLNEIVYNKLILQHEEAKERGLEKLASGIIACTGSLPEDELITYSSSELEKDLYLDLWKAASNVLKYYDVTSADSEKINDAIEVLTDSFVQKISKAINKDSSELGPLEPKLIGE